MCVNWVLVVVFHLRGRFWGLDRVHIPALICHLRSRRVGGLKGCLVEGEKTNKYSRNLETALLQCVCDEVHVDVVLSKGSGRAESWISLVVKKGLVLT